VVERDKRADVMVRFLDVAKNIEAFHGKKMEEIFKEEITKRNFLESLNAEEFEGLISGVNGILRKKEKKDWGMDGGAVALVPGAQNPDSAVIPPREGDKSGLFKKLYEGMKTMIEDERNIDDIALLLSSGINEVHSYGDANGRTSRLIYTLLTENFDDAGKERVKNVLSEYGSFYVDINPGFIGSERNDIIHSEVGMNDPLRNPENITNLFNLSWDEMPFQNEVTDDMKRSFKDICRDSRHGLYAAFKLISKLPNRDSFLKAYDGRSVIIIEELAKLNKDQMSELIEEYWALKRRLAEILIDLIVNPGKPEYQIEMEEGKMSLLEYFKTIIKREQARNKELL
jgi:hypothetical protein